ncbi:MAG TPA: glycerophosphodiester phosphodiesterase family protein [Actinomycetota bacterium]|nr:glycerophosphodiester phosphodiesterase family protein [Actinomycetota bacterium]
MAHRGASAQQPENTIAAFEAAARAGADAIELDVRLTADGVPVVLHDPDVSVTTDGLGHVHELTIEQIKQLDAASGRAARHEVPTLAEALNAAGRLGVSVDLEIKNLPGEPAFDSPREAVLEATLDALRQAELSVPVLITSFNWLTIERSRQLAPEIPTGFLSIAAVDAWAALVYVRQRGHGFVLPQTPALLAAGEEFVRQAHAEGIRVGTWVADDEDVLATLFEWEVDAVAANDPAHAVAVRDRVLGQGAR